MGSTVTRTKDYPVWRPRLLRRGRIRNRIGAVCIQTIAGTFYGKMADCERHFEQYMIARQCQRVCMEWINAYDPERGCGCSAIVLDFRCAAHSRCGHRRHWSAAELA